MFWSKYNILSESKKYGYLLYNTMSQVFLQIDKEKINDWLKLKQSPNTYTEYSFADFLISSKIIVNDQEDDLNIYLTDVLKNKYNPTTLSLTILPTRGCNFGCIYCYEKERPMVSMDQETEISVVNFVKNFPHLERLDVTWYGGEPLMNFESIIHLSKEFLALGIKYSAKIISNGYLLTQEKAKLMEKLSIQNIQITFDGPEKVHDNRRPLLGGQPTYKTILNNIKYLLSINKSIYIDIRTNIDRRNMQQYADFYEAFKNEINSDQVTLYPGFVSDLLSSECVSPEHNISEGGYKAQFALDLFERYGIEIRAFLPKFRRHSCVATKYHAFVIGPEGEIYKCWRMVGNPEQVIGHVKNGIQNMAKFANYITRADYTRDKKCLNCEFIPLCGGGCPLIRLRNHNEGIHINHCCPEKTHMAQLMEMRYEMFLKSNEKK